MTFPLPPTSANQPVKLGVEAAGMCLGHQHPANCWALILGTPVMET